jgi:LysM repeat protein
VRGYDRAGRQTEYVAYSSPGAMQERRVTTYNDNGQQLLTENRNGSNTLTATIKYNYTDSYDAVGNLKKYTVENHSGTRYLQTYTYDYLKAGSYQQQAINGNFAVYYSNGTTTSTGKTTFFYDANGNQIKITDSQDATKNRDLIVTTQGQILQRLENGKKQYYYYAQGQSVGSVGDLSSANFDYNYTPVGSNYPAQSPSSYVVNQGDTLQGIALAVFGDAGLWYLIADANGLKSDADLKTGQTLTIPNQITNVHNNSGTFKPYNPGELLGDTSPTLPSPDPLPLANAGGGGGGCGVLGMIIMIVVAIVVTVFTAGAALAVIAPGLAGAAGGIMAAGTSVLLGTAGLSAGVGFAIGFAAGAVGSIASQLVGMATGNVQEFSWGAVAASGLTAGIGASGALSAVTGGINSGLGITSKVGQAVVGGVVNNIAGQGVSMVTGQQKQFSWSSVAFSMVTAGIQSAAKGTAFDGLVGGGSDKYAAREFSWTDLAKDTGTSFARSAVIQAVSNHGKVNWESVAADAFGHAIGNAIVGHMAYMEKLPAAVARVNETLKRFEAERGKFATQSQQGREAYSAYGEDPALRNQTQNLMDEVTGRTVSDWEGGLGALSEGDKLAWASQFGFTAHQQGTTEIIPQEWDGQQLAYSLAHSAADEFQDPKYAFMHSMSNGDAGQSDMQARELANHWMRFNLGLAIEYAKAGDLEGAAFHEGLALHTIQDSTSPSHRSGDDFQLLPWHEHEGFGATMEHVSKELFYPGRDSNFATATAEFHSFVRGGFVPAGDLIDRYGVDTRPKTTGIPIIDRLNPMHYGDTSV